MALIGWIALVLASAVAGWFAAVALRWREGARCVATALVPVSLLTAVTFWYFITGDIGPLTDEQQRWRVVFLVVSLVVGSFAALPALPVWLVLESRLGARGR